MIFTNREFVKLHRLAFELDELQRPAWPGYRPEVLEVPNGDGNVDAQKRYAHVAPKYLQEAQKRYVDASATRGAQVRGMHAGGDINLPKVSSATHLAPRDVTVRHPMHWDGLVRAFDRCYAYALDVALAEGVPDVYWPERDACAMRILSYPIGAKSAPHADFDLFTINAYRNTGGVVITRGEQLQVYGENDSAPDFSVHYGELWPLCGLKNKPTHHQVRAREIAQFSVVFFALPSHAARLTSGETVGEWLAERIARSRVPAPGKALAPDVAVARDYLASLPGAL